MKSLESCSSTFNALFLLSLMRIYILVHSIKLLTVDWSPATKSLSDSDSHRVKLSVHSSPLFSTQTSSSSRRKDTKGLNLLCDTGFPLGSHKQRTQRP